MSSMQSSGLITEDVPRRGMPLGWLLSLYTSMIVAVVMGFITIYQETGNTKYEHQQIVENLRTSLMPLAAFIENAPSVDVMTENLTRFQEAYAGNGGSPHYFTLSDLV